MVRRAVALTTLTLALGCGPGLVIGEGGEISDSVGGTIESSSSETETGDGDGDGDPPMMPEACPLVRVDGDAYMPINPDALTGLRLTTLHPGDPETPARVMTIAHETFGDGHGEYRARSFVLEPPWPEGVVETQPSLPLTHSGHYLSRLAELDDDHKRFAYVWAGDPDGTNDYDTFFSVLDTEAWSVSGEVEIESSTNASFVGLLRVPASGAFVSTYTTDTFGSTPAGEVSGFSLERLTADGTPQLEAVQLTARTPEPGSNVRTFWAGDRVAVAIGHNDCDVDDDLCSPHAIVLARTSIPDARGAALDDFEVAYVFEGLPSTNYVSRPQVSTELGITWLTWYEGDDWIAPDEHRTLRAVVLDPSGDPVSEPISFVADTAMDAWPTLLVSEFGITVAYRTANGFFELRHHDFDLQPLGSPILLELDSSWALYPGMATLAHPRSLLLAWHEEVGEGISVRMVRLECQSP